MPSVCSHCAGEGHEIPHLLGSPSGMVFSQVDERDNQKDEIGTVKITEWWVEQKPGGRPSGEVTMMQTAIVFGSGSQVEWSGEPPRNHGHRGQGVGLIKQTYGATGMSGGLRGYKGR